jgi:hypothetical protein
MPGKVITGSRQHAELQAHSMINRWLEKPPRKRLSPSKFKLRHFTRTSRFAPHSTSGYSVSCIKTKAGTFTNRLPAARWFSRKGMWPRNRQT